MGKGGKGPISFIEGRDLFETVIESGLLKAREKVRIITANLKNFHLDGKSRRVSVVSKLRELAHGGVRIEILHGAVPSEPFLHDVKSEEGFPAGSFEMKFCQRVHAKALVIDYRTLYMGSANFTGAGLGPRSPRSRNFEIGIVTQAEEQLDAVMSLFDRVWSGSECDGCLLRRDCPEPLEGISY